MVLRKAFFVVLALVLLTLPLAARWFYYYGGAYEPGEVPRPNLDEIEAPLSGVEPFADRYTALQEQGKKLD